ncbi:MAG TPA: cytochrome c oxidase subunit II [Nocardioides sp.]|nr:cytochrome c oxidase subunit II [Nocardioides sp.]
MGRQVPASAAATPRRTGHLRRAGVLLGALALAVSLTGCSEKTRHEWSNLAMPDPATAQGEHIFMLWRWAWVAALVTGAIVWGLILYAAWRFRRRSDDEVPVQTRYNLPLEIFYTIAPIIMVVVFFVHTERTQNAVREDVPNPDVTIYVVGQQWTWTFNYLPGGDITTPGDKVLYSVGEAGNPPTLVLPVDKTVEFKLHSPDVIHDFGVPGFLEKMDVIPGPAADDNHFQVKPTVPGTYRGKCYELCGVYHSRMLFNVKIVSDADFQTYLQQLQSQGLVANQPLLGGITSQTQSGLAHPLGTPEGGSQ